MTPRAARWTLLGALAALGVTRLVDVVVVRGRSMAPTLLPGDRLLAARLHRAVRAGDVVLAPDPRETGRELVKRVAVADHRCVRLRGDNPAASTDARTFGAVPRSSVRWRVVARYWPPRRAGRLGKSPIVQDDDGGESACAMPQALIVGDP